MLFLSVAFLCSGDLTLNMGFSHTLLLELLEFGSSVNLFIIVVFHTFEWKNDGLIGCDRQIQAGAFDLLFSPQTLCAVTVLSRLKEHHILTYAHQTVTTTRKHALNCWRLLWGKIDST